MARVQVINPQTATGEAKSLLDAARNAGLADGEIVEVIAVVALNIFTNLLGKATRVEIDFPKVDLLAAPVRSAA